MKVVHIALNHAPRDSRIYYKECRSLADAGYEVHLLVREPPAQCESGVRFQAAASHRTVGTFLGRLLRALRWHWANFRRARKLGAQVYHIHETPLIPLALLLKLTGRRVIYDVHEDAPRQALGLGVNTNRPVSARARWLVYSLMETAARIVFDGFVAATPQIAARFPSKRTIVVKNFALPDEAQRLAEMGQRNAYADREPLAVYVGGLFRIRGAREMVQAMANLPESMKARLLLAGSFSPPELQGECETIDGWQTVDYLGILDRDGVLNLLTRARVGLVTIHSVEQYRVSWPIKFFEYMAAALPVVASDFPLWREVFEPIGCALFVDPHDPRAIAGAIRHLLEHPREAEAMGQRGRQAMLTQFNWENEAPKLLDLYRRIADTGRGTA